MYSLLLWLVSKVFHERLLFRYNWLFWSVFACNKNKSVIWIINSFSEQLPSKRQMVRNFQTVWITSFPILKLQQTIRLNNFDHMSLYAHKYQTELKKKKKHAHDDKLKASLKRLMHSEVSDKSCLGCTAYNAEIQKWFKSSAMEMGNFIQSLRLCYATAVFHLKISSFYYIFSLQDRSAKNWGKIFELFTICHRNSEFQQ